MKPHQEFEGIYNFRDVGATFNSFCSTPIFKEGLFFRSGRLDDATPSDRSLLSEDYGIKTVLDFLQWTTHNISLLSRRLELRLLLELPWFRLLHFLFLVLLGHRIPAARLLASHVIQPKGLFGLTIASLRHCKPELLCTLELLRDADSYPVLMHCTQGKDRTGIVSILVGLALGAPMTAVVGDYVYSNAGLVGAREMMVREFEDMGLGLEYLEAPEKLVFKVVEILEEEFGGIEAYFDSLGFGKEQREELAKVLLV